MRVERLLAPPEPLGGLRTVAGSVAMGLLMMLPLAVAVAPAVMVIATTYCPYDLAIHPTVP
jgi:hypothetical protein